MDRDKRPAAEVSTISHAVRLGSAGIEHPWGPRKHRGMVKALPAHCDVASAVASLANELLTTFPGQPDGAALLDRLRRRLNASDAVVWVCEGKVIWRVLRSGHVMHPDLDATIDLDLGGAGIQRIQRLRHAGTVLCLAGDVTGLEPLVPRDARSFAAAATVGGETITYVLVVGWSTLVPPCTAADAVPLQVAAALLAGTLRVSLPATALDATSEAIFASLPDPVAVVDRDGRIIRANARWTDAAAESVPDASDVPGPAANYLDVLRRAANNNVQKAAELLEGIAAVSAGRLDRFQTTYRGAAPDQAPSAVITVTPLHHPGGGALIAYAGVRQHADSPVADGGGRATFERLTDEAPIPLVMTDPRGQVLHANQQWWDASGNLVGNARGPVGWTDGFDAGVSAQATTALRTAMTSRTAIDLELRLKGLDGLYRWWALTLAPRFAHDGAVDGCIGVCHDVTTRRQMQATLAELARKLIAAQETERARIARELHDDLGQQVALLATQLDTLTPTSDRQRERELESARDGLHALARSLTNLSRQLHPGKIRLLGVARTLESLCREMGGETGVRIEFGTRRVPRDLPEDYGVSLFRVAQEALRNAVKHSGATAIVVRLVATRSHLTLRITDNGKGFDPQTTQASGIGLLTMRERVELVNGTLAVEPARPHGTTIRVVVPLVEPQPATSSTSRHRGAGEPRPVPVAARVARPAFSAPTPRSSV